MAELPMDELRAAVLNQFEIAGGQTLQSSASGSQLQATSSSGPQLQQQCPEPKLMPKKSFRDWLKRRLKNEPGAMGPEQLKRLRPKSFAKPPKLMQSSAKSSAKRTIKPKVTNPKIKATVKPKVVGPIKATVKPKVVGGSSSSSMSSTERQTLMSKCTSFIAARNARNLRELRRIARKKGEDPEECKIGSTWQAVEDTWML